MRWNLQGGCCRNRCNRKMYDDLSAIAQFVQLPALLCGSVIPRRVLTNFTYATIGGIRNIWMICKLDPQDIEFS